MVSQSPPGCTRGHTHPTLAHPPSYTAVFNLCLLLPPHPTTPTLAADPIQTPTPPSPPKNAGGLYICIYALQKSWATPLSLFHFPWQSTTSPFPSSAHKNPYTDFGDCRLVGFLFVVPSQTPPALDAASRTSPHSPVLCHNIGGMKSADRDPVIS